MSRVFAPSIRTKILLGCISLTFVTMLVGILSQRVQGQLSDKALGIYDNSFQSMTYLRSAQTILLGVSRDLATGEGIEAVFVDQLQSALDALDVVSERAMSTRGADQARTLLTEVSDLQTQIRDGPALPTRQQFRSVEQGFDAAVATYASDGFRFRGSAETLVSTARWQIYAAMAGSVLVALIITLMLSRAIVPSIRQAVTIATAIASGKLDNRIDRDGPSETGVLLRALSTMQAGIARQIECIETLMAQQASGHVAEIARQHARFETALNHMTLGLCMFDADNKLLVRNRRFLEMFGPEIDGDATLIETSSEGFALAERMNEEPLHSRTRHHTLADGRMIAVAEEAMADGGRVVTYEDVTERQRAQAHLSHIARHDALTGLPNRLLFREHLQRLTSERHGTGLISVICLDLDGFKTVNDTLGHPVGDALLQETAARLLAASDPADTVVRLGGDEFAVIRRCDGRGEQAEVLAERLIDVLRQAFDIDGHHIAISVSIGIAQAAVGCECADTLLKNADLALYAAKADGRGIYRMFRSEMEDRLQSRRRMELDLRTAIAEEQFEIYYQPIIDAQSNAVVAFEALLRWHHPDQGFMPPAEFIPLAEEAGLIPTIGLWVLNRACLDAREWPSHVRIAVNLSPLQFRSMDLIGHVQAALDQSGLCPSRLDIEITESLMLENTDMTLDILHSLRTLGVGISMDDFGTGYSSLSYLRRFPFDKIKIDRSFIRDLVESHDGLSIVKAVIALGHSLQMKVVAEGVETQDQLDLLRDAGCQQLQGYIFSRPQPLAAVDALIDRFSPENRLLELQVA